MGAVRFEGVDILDSLGQIMELHTQHYKDDFDLDKELIPKLALSGEPEDRPMPSPSKTCRTKKWSAIYTRLIMERMWSG